MTVKLLRGDCREVLKTLPAKSVHCVVTSPPYWGLRDYGTATWKGGDDPKCDHKVGRGLYTIKGFQTSNPGSLAMQAREVCKRCGARRVDSQIGLEDSLQDYINEMVVVFRELRRVLRDDGVVWLNVGDAYAGSGKGGDPEGKHKQSTNKGSLTGRTHRPGNSQRDQALTGVNRFPKVEGDPSKGKRIPRGEGRWGGGNTPAADAGLKPKDRMMLPARLALALQADGWYLRDEIIWSKPNPMPSSVTDRLTTAHEMVYLLSKKRRYYFDQVAIAEPFASSGKSGNKERKHRTGYGGNPKHHGNQGFAIPWEGTTRNKRSVWTIGIEPFPEAHFATFPTALVEPCIKASASEHGVCAKCGAPYERKIERASLSREELPEDHLYYRPARYSRKKGGADDYAGGGGQRYTLAAKTTGWRRTCSHKNAGLARPVALDPFGGSGTVGIVAARLNCDALLVELNPAYIKLARKRLKNELGLFSSVEVVE